MGFLFARQTRCAATTRSSPNPFRPRIEALEDRCLLSAGALDPTFGALHNGMVTGPIQESNAYRSNSIVVQSDGKMVLSGFTIGASGYQNFALVRYNPDGTVDPAFNGGNAANVSGSVATSLGDADADVRALALQSDGKIVAVGQAVQLIKKGMSSDEEFAIARYNANGSLDTSFNSTGPKPGTVLVNISVKGNGAHVIGGIDYANAVAIDGSGRIIVGGTSSASAIYGGSYGQFTLLRFKADGKLDSSFGNSGIDVTPKFGGVGNFANALAIQADGKIVLAGAANGMAAARYLSATGALDPTFGTNGIVQGLVAPGGTGATAYGLVLQNNGAVVLTGNSGAYLALARLTGAGQLDLAFGGSNTGFAINPNMGIGFGAVQAPNGDLLTAGAVHPFGPTGPPVIGVAAVLAGGTPDTSFGSGGIATADFPGGDNRGRGIAIQADGKLLVSGISEPNGGSTYSVALARFLPPNTKIGTFTANPNPVAAGSSVTLSAANIMNSYPASTITQVTFYLDDGDSVLNPSSDTILGYGTTTSPGIWTFTSSSGFGLPPGTYKLFAQALDSNGIFSDPLAISLVVF